jgi:ribosomal protein S18 acetylase RimI-like enzyme
LIHYDRMQIRPMTEDDVPAADVTAWAALREQIPDAFAHENEERSRRGRYRIAHLLKTDPAGAWVADDGGEIVGVALALIREGLWGFSLFGVRPGHQGRGIGRRLLDAVLAYGDGCRGAVILSTTDPRAMRRYARAGFELRPCVAFAGIVDRSAIPAGLRSRPGDREADRELCDTVSRHVRGAAHGPDLEAFEAAGCSLLVHDDGGWAAVRDGSPALLAARDDAIASDLLWSALAQGAPGTTVHVDFVTAGHDWAVQACLAAQLALSPDGPVFVRGDVGPLAPYLPSGAYL